MDECVDQDINIRVVWTTAHTMLEEKANTCARLEPLRMVLGWLNELLKMPLTLGRRCMRRSDTRPFSGYDWTCTAKISRTRTREDRPGETLRTGWLPTRGVETLSKIEDATNITRDMEHRLVEEGPHDLVTVLLLKNVSGRDDHLGAYVNRREKR